MVLRQELGIESFGSTYIGYENVDTYDSEDAWWGRFICRESHAE
jgi:hypothetical protein